MRYIVILILLSLLPLNHLTQSGLPVTHDGPDHVARIANFYQSLSEGNIVPRWAANLNWGFGHPVLMFLYPLPSYMASMFRAIGFSFIDSTKLVFAVSYIASILAMYIFLKRSFGNQAGFIGALMYGFAPYRFVDLSVRGAIGEHMAFVFLPLILLGLHNLVETKRAGGMLLTGISVSGLLLSHNAVSIMFMPIVAAYILFLYLYESRRSGSFILRALVAVGFGFGLASFFWIPAFFEGKYTLRDIVTRGEISGRFVPWERLFTPLWSNGGSSEMSYAFGPIHWLTVGMSLIMWRTFRDWKKKILLAGVIVGTFLSLFLMTQWSSAVWTNISVLQKFQFPWRFLSLAVFFSSIAGAVVISTLRLRSTLLMICTVIVLLATTAHMWQPRAVRLLSDDAFTGIYPSTTDTGESSPIWSVRFMERYPDVPMEVIDGDATVRQLARTTTSHEYAVSVKSNTRIVENTLYFPGWNVYVDGTTTPIEFQDPSHRGLMTFWIDPGDHVVTVAFRETKLRSYANAISLVSVGILIFGSTILIRRKSA